MNVPRGTSDSDTSAVWAQTVAWALALTIAAAVLGGVGFQSKDPDSALYADMVADLAGRPLKNWLAPEWGGHWNREGPFREHPPGLFLLSMPLTALGYPAAQAPFVVNALFQVLSLLLLQQLARVFATRAETRALGWLLQLLPIAFVFRIRANHEQVVLCGYLAALVATERARTRPAWFAGTAVATLLVLLVKGAFAAIVPASCAVWLLLRPAESPRLRVISWCGLGLVVGVAIAGAAGYEYVYRRITQESFFGVYVTQQIGLATSQTRSTAIMIFVQKLRNAGWYVGRVLWFAFPWSLAPALLLVPRLRRAWCINGAMIREVRLFLAMAALYILVLSVFDRRADRYAFPVYYLAGLVGAVIAMRGMPRMRRLQGALARVYPAEQVLVWAVAFALALPSFWNRFPKFKIINNY